MTNLLTVCSSVYCSLSPQPLFVVVLIFCRFFFTFLSYRYNLHLIPLAQNTVNHARTRLQFFSPPLLSGRLLCLYFYIALCVVCHDRDVLGRSSADCQLTVHWSMSTTASWVPSYASIFCARFLLSLEGHALHSGSGDVDLPCSTICILSSVRSFSNSTTMKLYCLVPFATTATTTRRKAGTHRVMGKAE